MEGTSRCTEGFQKPFSSILTDVSHHSTSKILGNFKNILQNGTISNNWKKKLEEVHGCTEVLYMIMSVFIVRPFLIGSVILQTMACYRNNYKISWTVSMVY